MKTKKEMTRQLITDEEIAQLFTDKDIIEDWWCLFSDDFKTDSLYFTKKANDFLRKHGVKIRVAGVVGQNADGEITWILK